MLRKSIVLLAVVFSTLSFAGEKLNICMDKNLWYPFTFVESGKASGLHIDIITKALTDLGYEVNYKPLPWKRCVASAKEGKFDAIAVASYKDKRAEFLNFPADAATSKKSIERVMQVEYSVVTVAEEAYEFGGDVSTIPEPVRVPRGYSVGDGLKEQGVKVDDGASGDEKNIQKLLRLGKGSVVTLPQIIELLSLKDAYKNKLYVSKKPVKSKSYYLPFSKKSKISTTEQSKIWKEIAKVRTDSVFMEKATAKY